MTNRKSPRTKHRIPAELPGRSAKSEAAPAAHHILSGAAVRKRSSRSSWPSSGFSVPHLRGRGVRDPHRFDGAHLDGPPQGRALSQVRLPLPGQRERGSRREGVPGRGAIGRHLPDVPLHGSWAKDGLSTTAIASGGQIAVRVRPAAALGRGRFPLSRRGGDEFYQAVVGLPRETLRIRDGDIWVRRLEDKDQGDAGFTIARKPAAETPLYAPAGVRQRLHAADRQVWLACTGSESVSRSSILISV